MKTSITRACRLLLKPIASVVMKCGMTSKEFAEISKSVFVEVASVEYGIRGRPTNVSRVSILTGISRKEVCRQRELLTTTDDPTLTKTTDANRVLARWHQDPQYLNDSGEPIALIEYGPAPSFESLFKSYGGDTPQQTLLKELTNAGSVSRGADGSIEAQTRYHMPAPMNEAFIQFLGSNLYDHAQTLNNNLSADSTVMPRFEGFAVDDRIDPKAAPAFKEFIDIRAQQFLEEVDDWLSMHRTDESKQTTLFTRMGVGIYAIDGVLPAGKKS